MKTTTNINPNSNRNAMIRKLTFPLAAAAAALALLAACTAADPLADDRPAAPAPDDDPRRPVPIRLEPACVAMPDAAGPDAGPAHPGTPSAAAPPATRAVTNPDYSNSWQEGDAVGLYIVKGDAGLQTDGSNWVNNLKMTYTGGKWQYTLPEGKECYPSDGEKLSFYAYYPYEEAYKPEYGVLWDFLYDQRNRSEKYPCLAQTTGVGKTHDPVPLAFVPLAAMVEVKVKNSAKGHPGGRASELLVVTLQGCTNGFVCVVGKWPAPVEPGNHYVMFRRVEQPGDADYATSYTYRALIPAQTLPRGTQLVFSHSPVWTDRPADQPQLRYTLPKDVKLEWGHYNRFEVTLEPKGTLENYLYKVGAIYPQPDCGLPLGVVYETEGDADDGEHGKIVGLSEVNHLQWGTEDPRVPGYAGIATPNAGNGRLNMNTLYGAHGGSFPATYPLFRWAAGLNPTPTDYADRAQKEVWYVPAEKEALDMLIQADKINKALKSAGYKEMNEAGKDYFMTSTSNEGNFIGLGYLNGSIMTNNCPKSQSKEYWCRPILEF